MSKIRYGYGLVRVSTDKQEEISPDTQEKLLKEYAKKNNIVITKIFYEIGVSGRKAEKRLEFQRMIASAKSKEHPVDVILVWKFSRFARNQEESIVYKTLLKKQHNVEVISISEPLVDGPFGSLIERIIEWMDEYYSIRLSGEVFRGMKENAVRGKYQARPPLGYRIIEHGKPPVIVDEEAEIIRLIFDLYANKGKSFFDIARYLNKLGCKTSHNKPFERRSIEYIIQNPTYYGMIRWNRTKNETNEIKEKSEWILSKGQHDPIISEQLFMNAQERYTTSHKPKGSRPSSTYKHWLSGLIKCPDCGRTLVATTMHKVNGDAYSYFSCYGYQKGKCSKPNGISSLVLEKEFLTLLKETLDSNEISFEYIEVGPTQINEKSLLNNKLKTVEEKEKRIKESYINGIDTLDEYKENKKMIQAEKKDIMSEIQLLDSKKSEPIHDQKKLLLKLHSVYDILVSDQYSTSEKNDAIRSVIDQVVYNRDTDTLKARFYRVSPN